MSDSLLHRDGHRRRRLRARVRHAALTSVPLWLTRGRLARHPSLVSIRFVQRSVALPSLPAELDGLRLTHLSDLHVGDVLRPEALPGVVDSVNQLKGDIIAVTGDFVDLSLKVLDRVIAGLAKLEAPLGVYLVLGNHDYLEDGHELIRRIQKAGLNLLINESLTLNCRGHDLLVSGIDFSHRDAALGRFVTQSLVKSKRANGQEPYSLRLLLSHHPHAFDPACRHGFDLTLAGHTHGGQIVLKKTGGPRGSLGLGSLAFRYPHGLYQRGHNYLYVTSGIGSWFPLRYQCPPEIACLTLKAGKM